MKKKTGRSTCSPARIFCCSKQKHSTLAKNGETYEAYVGESARRDTRDCLSETHSRRRNVIGRDTDHILSAPVFGRIESQGRLSGQDLDEPLLWRKLPFQVVTGGGLEMHGDPVPQMGIVVGV